METLTEDEHNELEQLRYALLDAPGRFSGYFHRMPTITAHCNGDIETLRVYDKFLSSTLATTGELDMMIRAARSLNIKPSELITRDYVVAWSGYIGRALRKNPQYKPHDDMKVCALVFSHFDKAALILEVIETRGVTDAEGIKSLIDDITTGAASLAEGVL